MFTTQLCLRDKSCPPLCRFQNNCVLFVLQGCGKKIFNVHKIPQDHGEEIKRVKKENRKKELKKEKKRLTSLKN